MKHIQGREIVFGLVLVVCLVARAVLSDPIENTNLPEAGNLEEYDDEGDGGLGKRDSFSRILRSSDDDEEMLNRILRESGIVLHRVQRSPPSQFSRILRDPSYSRILRSPSSFSRIVRGPQFSRILRSPSSFSRILRSPSTFSRILRASPASFSRILRSAYAPENPWLFGETHDRRPNRQYTRILRSDPSTNDDATMDEDTDMGAEK